MIALACDVGGTFTDVVLSTEHVAKVLTTPDDPAFAVVDGIRRVLAESGIPAGQVAAVAICLLHSYLDPMHETRLREIISTRTDVPIVCSHEIWPHPGKHDRARTTLISAYAGRLGGREATGGKQGAEYGCRSRPRRHGSRSGPETR